MIIGRPQSSNLYPYPSKSFYIYIRKRGGEDKYVAQRKYPEGFSKSAVFWTFEEALAFLNNLQ
jgi:hypothetical protein